VPKGPKGQKRPADVVGNAVNVMQIATGEARAKGRDELTQTNSVRRPSPALEFSKSWLASMSEVAQNRKILRGARNVQSWG
jgi:hypothetical protein